MGWKHVGADVYGLDTVHSADKLAFAGVRPGQGEEAAAIRGMYDEMLRSYPEEYWEGERPPRLNRYQGQDLIREISERSCRITLGSSERQDSIRGADYAMAHLSEVAFWKDTPKSSPTEFSSVPSAGAIAPDSDDVDCA